MILALSVADAAFSLALAFLFGDFCANLGWGFGWVTVFFFAVVAMIVAAVPFLRNYRGFVAIFLAALLFGSFYYHFFVNSRAAAFTLPFGEGVSFRAVITDEPKRSDDFLSFPARAIPPYSGDLTVFADPAASFRYGDLVQLHGVVDRGEQSGEDPVIFPWSASIVASHQGFFLREWMIDFKDAVFQEFNDILPTDEAALLGGMTLGGTDGMSTTLKIQMERSGTSYLVAMYGYKMAIIVFGTLAFLGSWVSRRKRFFLGLVLLLLFVVMTGGDASAVRAGIMGCIALFARELGRLPSMRNVIALTAAGMALFDPRLVVQAAFLLSFLSLIGIIYLSGPIRKVFGWDDDNGTLSWKEAVTMSLSSLIPIVPVVSATFGEFSVMAFFSNILLFPMTAPVLLSGCAVALLGFISEYLALPVARLAEIFLWYQLGVIRLFSVLFVPLPGIFNSTAPFVIYYSLLIFFIYHHGKRRNIP